LYLHQIKGDETNGYVAWMEKMRNAYKMLVDKPEGKKPHGRHRYRWNGDINMDCKETERRSVDSTSSE
jgi:hypothetical protein